MNRFAALLDRLAYEPRRNAKLRLMADYFRHVPDPERGWALAAMTGVLSFRYAKPGLIRGLAEERMDPTLFYLSWDYVGDLSETVALMWPARPHLPPGGGGRVAAKPRPGEGAHPEEGRPETPPHPRSARLVPSARGRLPAGGERRPPHPPPHRHSRACAAAARGCPASCTSARERPPGRG